VDWSSSFVVSSSSTVDCSSSFVVSSSSVVRPEVLERRVQAGPDGVDLLKELVRQGDVDEGHRRPQQLPAGLGQRHGLHVQDDVLPGRGAPRHRAGGRRTLLGPDLQQQGPQIHGPERQVDVLDQPAEILVRGTEQLGGPAVEERHPAGPADDDLPGRTRTRSLPVEPVQLRGITRRRVHGHVDQAAGLAGGEFLAGEEPPPGVNRGEQAQVRQGRLGLAEHEQPAARGGEVQAFEDPGLGLHREVHQRLSGTRAVDPGDRGVLDQVVTAEHHRAAQLPAHRPAIVVEPVPGTARGSLAARPRLPWRSFPARATARALWSTSVA